MWLNQPIFVFYFNSAPKTKKENGAKKCRGAFSDESSVDQGKVNSDANVFLLSVVASAPFATSTCQKIPWSGWKYSVGTDQ